MKAVFYVGMTLAEYQEGKLQQGAAEAMKIENTGGVKSSADIKKKLKSSAASNINFGSILDSAMAEEPSAASPAVPPPPTNPFLALQQISDGEAQRQKAVKYGNDLLNGLESLKTQMLTGEISTADLKRLEYSMGDGRFNSSSFSEPHLKGVIEEIETRVAVEIAKLEKEFL